MTRNKIILGVVVLALLIASYFVFIEDQSLFNGKKEEVIKYKEEEFTKVNDDGTFSYQNGLTKELKDQTSEKEYTLSDPLVIVDPYGVSPLSALVVFNTDTNSEIKLTVKGKNNNDLKYTFEKSREHAIPVYGLYANYENKVILEDDKGTKKELKIVTKDIFAGTTLDSSLLNLKVEVNKLTDKNKFYFITSPLTEGSYAYDSYGDLRWISFGDNFKEFEMLDNGNLVISSQAIRSGEVYNTDLIEMDLFGKIENYYKIDNGYHNDFELLPNGNYLVVSNEKYYSYNGDYVIEIDSKNGKNVKSYNINRLMRDIDNSFVEQYDDIWDYNSGIAYDKDNKAIILSYWQHGTVISIDYETGKLNWMFGNPDVWSPKYAPYFLKLTNGTDYKYPLSIQAASVTDKNILSIFDNGWHAYDENLSCSHVYNNLLSSIVDYKIDYKNKTIELVQRRLQNEGFGSYALGDYDKRYTNDLVLFGREFRQSSVNNSACQLYDQQPWDSYIVELKGEEILYKAKLSIGSYRVAIGELYKSNKNYELENGMIYRTDGLNLENDKIIDLSDRIKDAKSNEDTMYNLSIEDNHLSLNMFVVDSDVVNVLLVDKYGMGKEYKYKIAGAEEAESVIVSGLESGRYFVYLEINGEVFDLKQYMDF